MNLQELKSRSLTDLLKYAIEHDIENPHLMVKQELIFSILKKISESDIPIFSSGVLEVFPEGFGYLRSIESNYLAGSDDVYVAPLFIKKFGLKTGDTVECQIRAPQDGERYSSVLSIQKVNCKFECFFNSRN